MKKVLLTLSAVVALTVLSRIMVCAAEEMAASDTGNEMMMGNEAMNNEMMNNETMNNEMMNNEEMNNEAMPESNNGATNTY